MVLNTPPPAGRKAGFSSQLEPQHRHSLPLSRAQPLLVKRWKYLWRKEFVELRNGLNVSTTGWVDDITADGLTIWIYLSGGMGRVMIHQCDGIDVWRVDSRIRQNRSDPAAEKAHPA